MASRPARRCLAGSVPRREDAIMTDLPQAAFAVIAGHHADPFSYLGPHLEDDEPVVRVFLPGATRVSVKDAEGHRRELPRVHDAGLFAGPVASDDPHYRLCVSFGDKSI